jgi:cephalosporin-C deacetylase-like acetyl esterase
MWVTANLYLPQKSLGKMPAIIVVHSHHRPRTQAELQDMGILWARAGCAVLIMDQIGHGERIETYPWNREGYHSRYTTGMQLYIAGESLIKWMAWDIMRGVDLILERSDVNKDQIILLGAVAGGGDPAAVTAALDSRIAAVAPFNFGGATPGQGAGGSQSGAGLARPGSGSWETTRNLPHSIRDQFLPWLICASIAPRRLILSYEMGWDIEKVPVWTQYRKIFGLYDALDGLDEAHGFGTFPGPGECANIGPSQRKTMYPELHRWFGIPIPAEEPQDRRPEAELAALTPAIADEIKMTSVHQLAHQIAEAKVNEARLKLRGMEQASRRKWLQVEWAKKIGDIEPDRNATAQVRWTRRWDNSNVDGVTLEIEQGIIVPLLLVRPASARGRLPVVAVVSQGGSERFMHNRTAQVQALLSGGAAVCLLDVRGVGETSPDVRRHPLSSGISLAATELMLGNTLVGARLKDLRTVLSYLSKRSDIDPGRIGVWGDSDVPVNPPRLLLDESAGWRIGPDIQQQAEPLGGLLAILAGLYEDNLRAIVARRTLVSYLSVLESPFTYIPSDVIVPGISEAGDIADVAAAVAPKALLIEEPINGRNRPLGQPELERALAPSGRTTVRSVAGRDSVSEWLLKQF